MVTQYFTIELPQADVSVTDNGAVITFDRSGALSLWEDLGEALGQGNPAVVTGATTEALAAMLSDYIADQDRFDDEAGGGGPMMSPDEALARVQAMESTVPAPAARRNPGTGIGNG